MIILLALFYFSNDFLILLAAVCLMGILTKNVDYLKIYVFKGK